MLNPAVTHKFFAGVSGFSGHSVARIPINPAMAVKAAITAEMSRLQPILNGSASAAAEAAAGHSMIPAVRKTPTALANPTTPAMSKPHLMSFSLRLWFFLASRLSLKNFLLFRSVLARGPRAGNREIRTPVTSSTEACIRGSSRTSRRLARPATRSKASTFTSNSILSGYGGQTAWAVSAPAVKKDIPAVTKDMSSAQRAPGFGTGFMVMAQSFAARARNAAMNETRDTEVSMPILQPWSSKSIIVTFWSGRRISIRGKRSTMASALKIVLVLLAFLQATSAPLMMFPRIPMNEAARYTSTVHVAMTRELCDISCNCRFRSLTFTAMPVMLAFIWFMLSLSRSSRKRSKNSWTPMSFATSRGGFRAGCDASGRRSKEIPSPPSNIEAANTHWRLLICLLQTDSTDWVSKILTCK